MSLTDEAGGLERILNSGSPSDRALANALDDVKREQEALLKREALRAEDPTAVIDPPSALNTRSVDSGVFTTWRPDWDCGDFSTDGVSADFGTFETDTLWLDFGSF